MFLTLTTGCSVLHENKNGVDGIVRLEENRNNYNFDGDWAMSESSGKPNHFLVDFDSLIVSKLIFSELNLSPPIDIG